MLTASGRALTDGARWAYLLLKVSDFVTLPLLRRLVDTALAAALLLSVWTRSGRVEAMTMPPHAVLVQRLPREAVDTEVHQDLSGTVLEQCLVTYTVSARDTLWDIARRFYDDGTRYNEIFQANAGRLMASGEPFTNPRLIRPGWALDVPLPGCNVWNEGDRVLYTVRPGDSLWRIAKNFLADGLRWREVWELHQGRDMGGGRHLADPGLILPGWVLELPVKPKIVVDLAEARPSSTSTVVPPLTSDYEVFETPSPEPKSTKEAEELIKVQRPSGRTYGARWLGRAGRRGSHYCTRVAAGATATRRGRVWQRSASERKGRDPERGWSCEPGCQGVAGRS